MHTGSNKRTWLFIGIGVTLGVLAFALIVWPIVHAGTFQVQIREGGPDGEKFSVVLPVFVLNASLKLIPDAVADEITGNLGEEVCQYIDLAQAVCRGLQASPDFVLVSVESEREFVNIAKKGNKLLIIVEDGGDEVRVQVPLKALHSLLEELEP